MAIKEPGHGLIMIRRVRAHDRGPCVLYVHKYKSLRCQHGSGVQLQDVHLCVCVCGDSLNPWYFTQVCVVLAGRSSAQ